MSRFLNPARLQLAAVLIFPAWMIASQLIATGQILPGNALAESPAAVYLPSGHDTVFSGDDRVWTGEL